MKRMPLTLMLGLALTSACSDSPVQPSNPPPPGTGEVYVLRWTMDANPPGDLRAGVSEVTIDASTSTQGPRRFSIDFGDGTRVASVTARHVYPRPGTFTIKVEARDSQGSSTVSFDVDIKP